MENTATTVFISYTREDQELALQLYNDLKEAGAHPWIDAQDLLPGQYWKNEIQKAIRRSGYFIAIFSKNSVSKKGFFQKEVRMAMEVLEEMPPDQISFIPCRTEDVSIQYEVLNDLHWLDLYPSYSDGLRKLKLSIGISVPTRDELPDYRQLLKQMDQNLLRYKLAQTKNILNEPFLFQNPTWISELLVQTNRTRRRVYETITRIQMKVPMYNYVAHELGNSRFVIAFKHDKEYGAFSKQLHTLLESEGAQVLEAKTKKNEIPKGYSALVIPPNDAEAVMIRGSNGRSVYASSEGAFDADTGEKLSDEELENLSPGGGFYVKKG